MDSVQKYILTQRTENSGENKLRLERLEKVLSSGGGGKKKKNWVTTPLLFFVVQLDFVYHADNWTVHSKLYVRFFLLRALYLTDASSCQICYKKMFQSLLVNHLKYLYYYVN